MKIGLLGASNIAKRKFIPALKDCDGVELYGTAIRRFEKEKDYSSYGNLIIGYENLIKDKECDVIYISLPTGLHAEWTLKAIKHKKHVIVEKSITASIFETKEILKAARENNVVIHENFAFLYHKQYEVISTLLSDNAIGDIRLIRSSFGYPKRKNSDIRYDSNLGGGAILDCGCYTIRVGLELLGRSSKIDHCVLSYDRNNDVDIFGSITMVNSKGLTAQLSFGMDNSYKCELEIWGSMGCITTKRIFTAPVKETLTIYVDRLNENMEYLIEADNQFRNSILYFLKMIDDHGERFSNYKIIELQSQLLSQAIEIARNV